MNPFKKSSSAPAAASGTPTNTGGAQAQVTGAEAAAAPGRGQAETGNQDGARDGPTPPGRAQAPAEEEGHEGKLISNKIRTSLVGRNSVKISKTVPEDFPGSDPDFSSDPDQKSPSGMGGPALAKDRSGLGEFYGSDPDFSSGEMEFTINWDRAQDSGYKSFLLQKSSGPPDLSVPEQNRAQEPGDQPVHLARLGSGSESDSDSDFLPKSQSSPVNRAGSLRQGILSFPPPSCKRPGNGSNARSFEPDGGGEGEKTGPGRPSLVSETESGSEDFWEDSRVKRGGLGDFCLGQIRLRTRLRCLWHRLDHPGWIVLCLRQLPLKTTLLVPYLVSRITYRKTCGTQTRSGRTLESWQRLTQKMRRHRLCPQHHQGVRQGPWHTCPRREALEPAPWMISSNHKDEELEKFCRISSPLLT